MTLFDLGQRYIGIHELAEKGKDHPLIQWWLSLCGFSLEMPDETPWCSAFVNGLAWELRLPRSKSAMARSWLNVGLPTNQSNASVGWDVVVLARGEPPAGHVGLFAGWENGKVMVLGGNQSDGVTVAPFDLKIILGIRRLGIDVEGDRLGG